MRAFIERHLTSAVQLEVLLLLHGDRDRSWSAVAVGRELRINPDQAHEALARLAEDGLLAYDESVFRLAPSKTRKAELTDASAALYPT